LYLSRKNGREGSTIGEPLPDKLRNLRPSLSKWKKPHRVCGDLLRMSVAEQRANHGLDTHLKRQSDL
jgi:hypothetical protein